MFRARGLWSAALLCATMLAWPAPASPQGSGVADQARRAVSRRGTILSRVCWDKHREFDGRDCFALDCIAPISRDAAK
jgi:hypothetical protein